MHAPRSQRKTLFFFTSLKKQREKLVVINRPSKFAYTKAARESRQRT